MADDAVVVLTNNRSIGEKDALEEMVSGSELKIFARDCEIRNLILEAEEMVNEGHELVTDPLPPNYALMSAPVRSMLFSAGSKDCRSESQTEKKRQNMLKKLQEYRCRLQEILIDGERRQEYEKVDIWQLQAALQELARGGIYSEFTAEQNQAR